MRLSWGVALALVLAGCGTTVPVAPHTAGGRAPLPGAEPGLAAPDVAQPLPGVSAAPVVPGRGSAPAVDPAARPSAAAKAVPGATADRSPITVGILTTNNDAASSAGVDNGNTVTLRRAFEAAVEAWNARGGIAGRRVVPVYEEIASSSSSYSSDLERVCASFTQDRRVALVLSGLGLYAEQFGACLAKAGTPWIPVDYALGDDAALRSSSTLLTPTTVTTDVRAAALLRQLAAVGQLGPGNRLGVVVEGCPFNQRTYERTVVPLARSLGVPVAVDAVSRCFLGISDLSGLAAEMQNAVLRFQSSDVDRVVFVSGAMEGNLVLFFLTAAEAQQFRPRYGLTSAASPVVQEANTPEGQLRNAVGVGWLPELDSTQSKVSRPAQRHCLDGLRRQGLVTSASADRFFAFSACDALALAEALLLRTAGRTDAGAFLGAASALGRGLATTTTYGGGTDFSGGRRSAASTGRLFAWTSRCSCFDYTGPTFPLER